jgi:hypothetical protein
MPPQGEGSIHTEETKAKIAASLTGDRSPRFNKGTPVYLYEVHPTLVGVPMPPEVTGYELSAIFPNSSTQWLQEFGRAV